MYGLRFGALGLAAVLTACGSKGTADATLPGSLGHIHTFIGIELWLDRWTW